MMKRLMVALLLGLVAFSGVTMAWADADPSGSVSDEAP
jgi:hypothetical protein